VERQDELLRIALALKKGSSYFSSGWNINFLQAFIRDGGHCVYCGRDVMSEFCVACGDHLLPKRFYPALAQNVDNLVAACALCNVIKKDYDPSERTGMEIVLTELARRQLIDTSRAEIVRRKGEYVRDFETDKAAFTRAIAEYRQR
jgi:hypothetical protein